MTSIVDALQIDDDRFNGTMRPILLRVGLSFEEQFKILDDMIDSNNSASDATNPTEERSDKIGGEIAGVWYLRVQLRGALNTYKVRWPSTDYFNRSYLTAYM